MKSYEEGVEFTLGRSVESRTADFLCDSACKAALANLACGASVAKLILPLSTDEFEAIRLDLQRDQGWKRETWTMESDGTVRLLDASAGDNLGSMVRFSTNECLRRPADDAYALRGLIKAFTSNFVQKKLSAFYGRDVRFRSADIARYGSGDFLRRHSDDFEQRQFGFVIFLSESHRSDYGGELIVEDIGGKARVLKPKAGNIAVLKLAPGYFHQVAEIRSLRWERLSIAIHYVATS